MIDPRHSVCIWKKNSRSPLFCLGAPPAPPPSPTKREKTRKLWKLLPPQTARLLWNPLRQVKVSKFIPAGLKPICCSCVTPLKLCDVHGHGWVFDAVSLPPYDQCDLYEHFSASSFVTTFFLMNPGQWLFCLFLAYSALWLRKQTQTSFLMCPFFLAFINLPWFPFLFLFPGYWFFFEHNYPRSLWTKTPGFRRAV